jgi:hypothetical protein
MDLLFDHPTKFFFKRVRIGKTRRREPAPSPLFVPYGAGFDRAVPVLLICIDLATQSQPIDPVARLGVAFGPAVKRA